MYEVCVAYLTAHRYGRRCVLLGHKQRGVGDGKVVAPGGKLEPGESARAAVIREIAEETGLVLSPDTLTEVGTVAYTFPTKPEWSQRSHVFTGDVGAIDPVDSSELHTWWCPVADIPFHRMWQDAAQWVPAVLAGAQGFTLAYSFGSDLSTLTGDVETLHHD